MNKLEDDPIYLYVQGCLKEARKSRDIIDEAIQAMMHRINEIKRDFYNKENKS